MLLAIGCRLERNQIPNPQKTIRLAVTTSTRDSGLLDGLLPVAKKTLGVRIHAIAVGSGAALTLGREGDVDVLIVHSPDAEHRFVDNGYAITRVPMMSNSFVILGPKEDPANITGLRPTEAFTAIAKAKVKFLSRGDDSGTHSRERKIWALTNTTPAWAGYLETGQGMGATLTMANQMLGYTLCDRGTFLRYRDKIDLLPLVESGDGLENPYHVILVNHNKSNTPMHPKAKAVAEWFVSPEAQTLIRNYELRGEQLFLPTN